MKYSISADIMFVLEALDIYVPDLASSLGVARSTIHRLLGEVVEPSKPFLEKFYSFAYSQGLRINELKCRFNKETYKEILCHGARKPIEGPIDLEHSRQDIDVGVGFYMGESYYQASSYVFGYKDSIVYVIDTKQLKKLKTKYLDVSLEWVIMVCYFRGQIEKYKNTDYIQNLIKDLSQYDVIVAPIADNNMYDIMTRFARGDITDTQTMFALKASHLGKQYVLKTKKACNAVEIVDQLYLCEQEKKDIEHQRREDAITSFSQSRDAIEKYRREGKYIEELLK